jgi:hypothetical protein
MIFDHLLEVHGLEFAIWKEALAFCKSEGHRTFLAPALTRGFADERVQTVLQVFHVVGCRTASILDELITALSFPLTRSAAQSILKVNDAKRKIDIEVRFFAFRLSLVSTIFVCLVYHKNYFHSLPANNRDGMRQQFVSIIANRKWLSFSKLKLFLIVHNQD